MAAGTPSKSSQVVNSDYAASILGPGHAGWLKTDVDTNVITHDLSAFVGRYIEVCAIDVDFWYVDAEASADTMVVTSTATDADPRATKLVGQSLFARTKESWIITNKRPFLKFRAKTTTGGFQYSIR